MSTGHKFAISALVGSCALTLLLAIGVADAPAESRSAAIWAASFESSLDDEPDLRWRVDAPFSVTRTNEAGAAAGEYAAKIATNGGNSDCSCPQAFYDGFSLGEGDEVWIGGSWLVPEPSKLARSRLMNLGRYESAGGPNDWYLGLRVDDSGHMAVVARNYRTDVGSTVLVIPNAVPKDRWFSVDLHLKLSPGSGQALTEAYFDGQLVASTTQRNMLSDEPLRFYGGGIPYFWPQNDNTTVYFDVPRVIRMAAVPPAEDDACALAEITSCTLLKEDLGTGDVGSLWGNRIYCAASVRQVANLGYRRLSVIDGDNVWGERCEIGNNEHRNGENGDTGTFQLYREGQRKLTSMRIRLPGSFPLDTPYWQSVMQMKQAHPADNGGGTPALALNVYDGMWQLHQSTSTGPSGVTTAIWTAPATTGSWTRIAWDVTYSRDPSKGWIQMFIDLNGDGDALDANERSPVMSTYTLKRETATDPSDGLTDDGVAEGESIPSHLRIGIYHDDRISCPPPGGCYADYDDIQVFGVN